MIMPTTIAEDPGGDAAAMARTRAFTEGIDLVAAESLQEAVTALMCSEREPAGCHRALLVAQQRHRWIAVAQARKVRRCCGAATAARPLPPLAALTPESEGGRDRETRSAGSG